LEVENLKQQLASKDAQLTTAQQRNAAQAVELQLLKTKPPQSLSSVLPLQSTTSAISISKGLLLFMFFF